MAYQYRKYKIALGLDSGKTQGLRTGDIVRRQYFNGKDEIYSLMCVLDYGVDKVKVETEGGEVTKDQPWFIGLLLDGDAPQSGEILDFARVTSLFDTQRSGALYLTATDDQSPFMDVIDGIGRNCSLSWPENGMTPGNPDSACQYVVDGLGASLSLSYQKTATDDVRKDILNRVVTIHKTAASSGFAGLRQDFYQYVANPNQVIISYKAKATSAFTGQVSLGYTSGTETDGTESIQYSTGWEYKVHVITVQNSGRHLRSFKIDLQNLGVGESLQISDFNIILLSSVANFGDASQIRVGKLDGVVDPVFGRLNGYGGYLQKLFASCSAHISGTLTAGDENGFAATFYAGKIHKNAFLNSLDVDFVSSVSISTTVVNPTGIGKVYKIDSPKTIRVQSSGWLGQHAGQKYCLSFWIYCKSQVQISVLQNNTPVGTIQVDTVETNAWRREKVVFEVIDGGGDDMLVKLSPTFTADPDDDSAAALMYFSAPQLESGEHVTQYQPTDATLNYTDTYGAWFNRGGIGGTIQNPLLNLNEDGSISSRSNSFRIDLDGSGHFAKGNIKWNEDGETELSDKVKLTWKNFSEEDKKELEAKSIKIIGQDTFSYMGDITTNEPVFYPDKITLELTEQNLQSSSSQRQWSYLKSGEYIDIEGENSKTLEILPDGAYWGNESTLTVKCTVTVNQRTYTDTITLKKQYSSGYTVEVVSEKGQVFKNGSCETVLHANVYYRGVLVDPVFVAENFNLLWKKYTLPDCENEDKDWWREKTDPEGNVTSPAIDKRVPDITLDYPITGSDLFVCELQIGEGFPYDLPIVFAQL
uniref:Uncharacterized protein n=1 Tax=virus sp. ct0sl4 TaxID=2826788 RepID=A0A8S5MQ90_9VIRU|nr:MAG TPA: hypothetical protein [virus sp. ct0sl4]